MKNIAFILLISIFSVSTLNAQNSKRSKFLSSPEWGEISTKFSKIQAHNEAVSTSESVSIDQMGIQDTDHSVTLMLESTENATVYNDLLIVSGLKPYFESNGPFTFIVPNDAAIEALPDDYKSKLMGGNDIEAVREFVLIHVLPGKFARQELMRDAPFKCLGDEKVNVKKDGDGTNFGIMNLGGRNGVVHVIDHTLITL